MKRVLKYPILTLLAVFVAGCGNDSAEEETQLRDFTQPSALLQTIVRNTGDSRPVAQIDWAADEVRVTGTGTHTGPSGNATLQRAFELARTDAVQNLARALGEMRQQETDGVSTGVPIQNAGETAERIISNLPDARPQVHEEIDRTTVRVIYRVPRRSWPSPDRNLWPEYRVARLEDLPQDPTPSDPMNRLVPQMPVTGFIIDASGLGLQPGLSPVVLVQGSQMSVFEPRQTERVMMRQSGMVGYAVTVDDARRDVFRVGGNPLVIQAMSAHGTVVCVSAADARRILEADPHGELRFNCKTVLVAG